MVAPREIMAEAMFSKSASRKRDPAAEIPSGFYMLADEAIVGLSAAGFEIVDRALMDEVRKSIAHGVSLSGKDRA